MARPFVFVAWSVATGRTLPSAALPMLAEARDLAAAIAARTRAALA